MKSNVSLLLVGAAALLLAACGGGADEAPGPRVAAEETALSIAQGDLIGYVQDVDDGALAAHAWLGIPFAEAPVGDLRWRAPRSPRDWDGQLEALSHPSWCMQITNGLDAGYGYEAEQVMGSEDCLYLNVYAPAERGEEPLPVMVWIHGGGNTWGRAEQYDASTLAARENIIVVVIQYRLGPLGWLAHPALRDSAELEIDRTANFATMDMVASLLWVQDNIGVFGGDQNRVTIFGESAGGHNVASLLVTPQAGGLFHRAIIQSGGPETISMAAAEGSAPDPLDRGMATSMDVMNSLIAFVAPPTPEQMAGAMRSLDVEALYRAYHLPGATDDLSVNPARVIADGIVLPEDGILAAMADGRAHAVPVIAGSNRDETKLFNALDDRFTNTYFGVIIRPKDQRLYDLIAEYQSNMWQVRGVDDIHNALRVGGNYDLYSYRFDWDEEGSFLFTNFSTLLGAAHSWEIPFIFGHWSYAGRLDRVLWNDGNEEGRTFVSDAMMDYWAEFARTGVPGMGDGDDPEWVQHGAAGRIVFDTEADGGIRMEAGELTSDVLFARLAGDDRLGNQAEICLVYEAVVAWWPAYTPDSFMDGACTG